MNVLYILVPVALLLAASGVAAFVWSVRNGQFDDVETPGLRMIFDDESGHEEHSEPRTTAQQGDDSEQNHHDSTDTRQ